MSRRITPQQSNAGQNSAKETRFTPAAILTKNVLALLLSLSLFAGGIALLALRIPGWSLFLGLPSVQIGIVFLIFTFDELARHKVGPRSLHIVDCSVCGKAVLAPEWQEEKICRECQKKIAKKPKVEKD